MTSKETAQDESRPRPLVIFDHTAAFLAGELPFEAVHFDASHPAERRAVSRAIGEVVDKKIDSNPELLGRIGLLNKTLTHTFPDPGEGFSSQLGHTV